MKPKFQADADLHVEIVAGVLRREPAIDFQSSQEVFRLGVPDREVLAFAASEDRIVVSHDVNTMPAELLHFLSTYHSSPGVLLIPQSLGVGRAIEDLILIWATTEADEWRSRVHWLPL